jgi:hypothetical protein
MVVPTLAIILYPAGKYNTAGTVSAPTVTVSKLSANAAT